ncbi:MAG TPA: EpsG family protein [Steroidobacteraceae bacterium]|nr:EpsG family protein [Steroidobacteraceae bacterium]
MSAEEMRAEAALVRLPLSTVAYVVLALAIIGFALAVDRSDLLDQNEYVDYFIIGPTFDWLDIFDADSLLQGAIGLFADEFLWRMWTAVVGAIMEPTTAVLLTIATLNVLMALAFARLRQPVFALLLWAFLPVGLAVTGLVQLRQGFALSIFFCLALRWRRPLLGLIIAAAVHTTIVVPLGCYGVVRVLRLKPVPGAVVCAALATSVALVAGALFEAFGGRRLLIYAPDEGATSIFFAVGSAIMLAPSIWWLLEKPQADEDPAHRAAIDSCALAHIGTTVFVIVCFFVFPLGTSRMAYFTQLLLIPVLCSLRLSGPSFTFAIAPASLALGYWIVKAVITGEFAHALSL